MHQNQKQQNASPYFPNDFLKKPRNVFPNSSIINFTKHPTQITCDIKIYITNKSMCINDFLVLGKIGEGSYSSVHKVKRISDGNVYALKKQVKMAHLKQKQKQNALNEVRLLASISCQYLIAYKEAFFDSASNALCIVMEYAQGGDLQKLIETHKKKLHFVEEKQVWKMINNIVRSLVVLHDMKIIHRDLKSANVFINQGEYKLGDLNVSKLLKKNLAYTQTGTPYYASPEVWRDRPYQLKSDIWSLGKLRKYLIGCIIYEFCSLRPPFMANSMDGLYKKVLKGQYSRIPHSFSQTLERFIGKCLQQDPKNRPTAKQLVKLIPETIEDSDEVRSNINLLNTIRVPRNLHSLRQELPKSNYINTINAISDIGEKRHKKTVKASFSIEQKAKLKQMVRLKQGDPGNGKKSSKSKKVQGKEEKEERRSLILRKKNEKTQILPRIKVYSEPTQQNMKIINSIQKSRNYHYRQPAWWG